MRVAIAESGEHHTPLRVDALRYARLGGLFPWPEIGNFAIFHEKVGVV